MFHACRLRCSEANSSSSLYKTYGKMVRKLWQMELPRVAFVTDRSRKVKSGSSLRIWATGSASDAWRWTAPNVVDGSYGDGLWVAVPTRNAPHRVGPLACPLLVCEGTRSHEGDWAGCSASSFEVTRCTTASARGPPPYRSAERTGATVSLAANPGMTLPATSRPNVLLSLARLRATARLR